MEGSDMFCFKASSARVVKEGGGDTGSNGGKWHGSTRSIFIGGNLMVWKRAAIHVKYTKFIRYRTSEKLRQ